MIRTSNNPNLKSRAEESCLIILVNPSSVNFLKIADPTIPLWPAMYILSCFIIPQNNSTPDDLRLLSIDRV